VVEEEDPIAWHWWEYRDGLTYAGEEQQGPGEGEGCICVFADGDVDVDIASSSQLRIIYPATSVIALQVLQVPAVLVAERRCLVVLGVGRDGAVEGRGSSSTPSDNYDWQKWYASFSQCFFLCC
jgi:hypothetical protein